MFDDRASTYTEDYKIFKELGLEPFKDLDTHKRHFVGDFKRPDELVKIYVEPYPAQFWVFEIYNKDGKKIQEISTGSGSLRDYWQTVEQMLNGMISIENFNI